MGKQTSAISAMTLASDYDILHVPTADEARKQCGGYGATTMSPIRSATGSDEEAFRRKK